MAEPKAEGAGRERSFDVVTAWLTSPSVRRALAWLAGVGMVSAWSLAVMGISMSLADSDVEEWWILPLFGTAVLILALVAVYLLRPRAAPSSRAPFDDLRPPEHSRTLEPPQPPRQRRLPAASETLLEPLSDRELEILELLPPAGRIVRSRPSSTSLRAPSRLTSTTSFARSRSETARRPWLGCASCTCSAIAAPR